MEEIRDLSKFVGEVRGARAKKYNNYALTEAGKEKAEEYGGSGLEFEILNHLMEHGACTRKEIVDGVHVEEKKVQVALDRLIAYQRVIRVQR